MTPTTTAPRSVPAALADLAAVQATLTDTPTVELWLEMGRRLAADGTDTELAAVLTVAEQMLTAVRAL